MVTAVQAGYIKHTESSLIGQTADDTDIFQDIFL